MHIIINPVLQRLLESLKNLTKLNKGIKYKTLFSEKEKKTGLTKEENRYKL